jgi:hypothetical protein
MVTDGGLAMIRHPHSDRARGALVRGGGRKRFLPGSVVRAGRALSLAPCAAALCALPIAAVTQGSPWTEREAEHLLNRAGFGGSSAEVERAVELGREAFVAALFVPLDPDSATFDVDWLAPGPMGPMERRERPASEEERKRRQREMRRDDQTQLREYLQWWVTRMLRGEDPLRERMTLFWHGYFTSSQQDVKNSFEMIQQNQLLRSHALEGFAYLLRAIARDPAMLEYLDNDANRKENPNENFARELMELFTLGVGHYTEEDVKEAARAFTGWTDRNGAFRFARTQHDPGTKSVLGASGRFDGDDVIDVLLAQEACGTFVARRLLRYFEGVEPDERRVAEYGRTLRTSGYDVGALLRKLFLDARFYRDEVVAARIASPVDYLVGASRRLGAEPPAVLVVAGASLLGQRLFFPPNVKGWDEGTSWITTASLMQRGNLAGVLLGVLSPREALGDGLESVGAPASDPEAGSDEMDPMEPVPEDADARGGLERPGRRDGKGDLPRGLGELGRLRYQPRFNLSGRLARRGVHSDEEIVSALCTDLLAVPVGTDTRAELVRLLAEERERLGLADGALLDDPRRAEEGVRKLAHIVLSLPEAQLN